MRYVSCVLVLVLAAAGPAQLRGGVLTEPSCLRGDEAAATLLIPYFEVDLSDPGGRTTLVAVTNARAAPALAKAVVWSDWAIPVFSFDIYLTGFDVTTFNMRDVLRGNLPETGADSSPQGDRSDDNVSFAGCDPESVGGGDLDVPAIQAALSGEETPEGCWSSPPRYEGQARGYLTIDVVNRCSPLLPTDAGYFEAGGTGVAANANTLLGDVLHVRPDDNFAQGQTAVHLLADAEFFSDGDATFYQAYVGGSGVDARIPLSRRWGIRFLQGGGFNGGTDLVVWEDVDEPASGPISCGTTARLFSPPWLGHLELKIFYDEEENPLLLDSPVSDSPKFTLATQKVPVETLFIPFDFGWADLDIGAQAWVGATMSAENRFSVGLSAWPLEDPCRQAE